MNTKTGFSGGFDDGGSLSIWLKWESLLRRWVERVSFFPEGCPTDLKPAKKTPVPGHGFQQKWAGRAKQGLQLIEALV